MSRSSSLILIDVTVIDETSSSNIQLPIYPFPGLILIDAHEKEYRVTEVSCLMSNFAAEDRLDYTGRDTFGNAIQVRVEPVD